MILLPVSTKDLYDHCIHAFRNDYWVKVLYGQTTTERQLEALRSRPDCKFGLYLDPLGEGSLTFQDLVQCMFDHAVSSTRSLSS